MAESFVSFGYEDERFENTVDDDFHCAICMNVLKEPVMCQNNQHYFCTACIMRHLVQSEMCPTCREEMNVETLRKPPRILTNCLSNLNIRCENYERGCLGFVKLGDIRNHTGNCGFAPVKCSNDGCSIEVNKRDRIYHETEVCEFRKVKCHDCAELKKDFVEVKNDCAEVKKDFVEVKNDCAEMKRNYTEMKKEIEEVKDYQKQMMKELMSLAGMMVQIKEMTKKVEGAVATSCASASGPSTCVSKREDIIIAGGKSDLETLKAHSSVEMFSWHKRTWVRLNSMKTKRISPVSFVYGNTMVVAGGYFHYLEELNNSFRIVRFKLLHDMEQMVLNDDQEQHNWLCFPVELPKHFEGCPCVIFNDRIIFLGECVESELSGAIYEFLLQPPHTVKLLTDLPEGMQCHSAERFNEDILVIGRRTSPMDENCNSVVLYDVNRNVFKQMPPLPYPVSGMTTVTYGEFIVLIGGSVINGALNTVSMYNMRNGRSKMLPSMRHKRYGCTAVVTGNSIVVMGGSNYEVSALNVVECYSFDTNAWEELPPMNECRSYATSIVKTVK